MYLGKTLFAQVMDFLPWKTFHRIVDRYGGDHRTRSLSCAEQFRVMAFAQLTYRESLRDIEVCLAAQAGKLYHMGIGAVVARSTLADANESRDWRMFPWAPFRSTKAAVKLHTLLDLRGSRSCSSSGSNSICASSASTALPKTQCGRKSGSPSAFTCWWR